MAALHRAYLIWYLCICLKVKRRISVVTLPLHRAVLRQETSHSPEVLWNSHRIISVVWEWHRTERQETVSKRHSLASGHRYNTSRHTPIQRSWSRNVLTNALTLYPVDVLLMWSILEYRRTRRAKDGRQELDMVKRYWRYWMQLRKPEAVRQEMEVRSRMRPRRMMTSRSISSQPHVMCWTSAPVQERITRW